MSAGDLLLLESAGITRPQPKMQTAIAPPYDPSDPGGEVHTVLPPEQVIPPNYDIDWWRGDFGGVTLAVAPPFVPGANTTPPEMTMSFLLHMYNRTWQDTILTGHAERNYSHLLLSGSGGYDSGSDPATMTSWADPATIQKTCDLFAYAQAWGFYTAFWCGPWGIIDGTWSQWEPQVGPFLRALVSRGLAAKSICVLGKELNSWNAPGADGLDGIIRGAASICNPAGMPLYLHFTSNVPAWPLPGVPFADWWRQWIGIVRGLAWQADPYDPTGTMGAHLWDARRYLGAAGGNAFKVVGFELRATQQLYGQCSEARGCLTGWEILCCPNGTTGYPAVAGFGNGARYPNGRPI